MGAGKNTTARVQGKKSRGYTRGSVEKHRRAGTGEENARIYPWECGKTPPRGYRGGKRADIPVGAGKNTAARVQGKKSRGYRERNRADIPVGVGKNTAARVQGKKTRGYTRESGEKRRRAGTGEENA